MVGFAVAVNVSIEVGYVVISCLICGELFVTMYNIQVAKEMIQVFWSVGPDYEGVIYIMEPAVGRVCLLAEHHVRVLCETVEYMRKR
jgi:hypothetical protein